MRGFLCIFIIFSSVESSVCCGKDQAQSQARDCNEYTTSEPKRERQRQRERELFIMRIINQKREKYTMFMRYMYITCALHVRYMCVTCAHY